MTMEEILKHLDIPKGSRTFKISAMAYLGDDFFHSGENMQRAILRIQLEEMREKLLTAIDEALNLVKQQKNAYEGSWKSEAGIN